MCAQYVYVWVFAFFLSIFSLFNAVHEYYTSKLTHTHTQNDTESPTWP